MQDSRNDLLEIVDSIHDIPILVVGDLMLDRYIWGDVSRISPEAPVPVVAVTKTDERLGGAGNVVRNLINLGASVKVCGVVGDDLEGEIILKLLENEKIDREGVLINKGHRTCVKTRVIARAQQVVRIDREEPLVQGIGLEKGFAAVVDAHIESSRAVILSDYGKGVVTESLISNFEEAKKNQRIGLNARPLILDPYPSNYDCYRAITVATPNRREAEKASGLQIKDKETACQAGQLIMKKWGAEMMLVTLGEDGLVIVSADSGQNWSFDSIARDVFDVSGAGDTVLSVYSSAIAVGASPELAGKLANIAAGVVVCEVGTVPITVDQLREEVKRIT